MAFIGGLAGLGTLVSVMGTIVGAAGAMQQGKTQQAQMEYQAKLKEIQGQQEQAAQQRKAIDKERQGELVQSRLQAVASASGAGASDPTIINLSEGIAGRSAYEEGLLHWSGAAAKANAENAAQYDRFAGEAAKQQGNLTALGGMFKGAGTLIGGNANSMFDTYNPLGASRRTPGSVSYG